MTPKYVNPTTNTVWPRWFAFTNKVDIKFTINVSVNSENLQVQYNLTECKKLQEKIQIVWERINDLIQKNSKIKDLAAALYTPQPNDDDDVNNKVNSDSKFLYSTVKTFRNKYVLNQTLVENYKASDVPLIKIRNDNVVGRTIASIATSPEQSVYFRNHNAAVEISHVLLRGKQNRDPNNTKLCYNTILLTVDEKENNTLSELDAKFLELELNT